MPYCVLLPFENRYSSANHDHYTPPPTPPRKQEGRQSTALAGWGSSGLISNQADMILCTVQMHCDVDELCIGSFQAFFNYPAMPTAVNYVNRSCCALTKDVVLNKWLHKNLKKVPFYPTMQFWHFHLMLVL